MAKRKAASSKTRKPASGTAGKAVSGTAGANSPTAQAGKDTAKQLAAMEEARASAVEHNAAARATAAAQIQSDALKGLTATMTSMARPLNMAVDFESVMAKTATSIDGTRDAAGKLTSEYYRIEKAVLRLGRILPLTQAEIAGLFAAGGRFGLSSVQELEAFAVASAQMAATCGVPIAEAAEAVGHYQTRLGLSADQTREMLDLINHLAATGNAPEKAIAGIMGRLGSLGGLAAGAHKPMTALAATLASLKIPEESAAAGLENFLPALFAAGEAPEQQQNAFAALGFDAKTLGLDMLRDAEGSILAVLRAVQQLPRGKQAAILSELFGSESLGALLPLLTQLDLLEKNLLLAADKTQYAGATLQEFAEKSNTTATKQVLVGNRVSELAVTLGTKLLPAYNDTLAVVGRGLEAVTAFAGAHTGTVRLVAAAATAMIAFRAATLAGGFALSIASDAWAVATAVCSKSTYVTLWSKAVGAAATVAYWGMALGLRAVAAAQWLLNAVMSNNPIGWVVKGVMILGAVLGTLYNTCEPVRQVLDSIWNGFLAAMQPVFDKVTWVWDKIQSIIKWFKDDSGEAEAVADRQIAEHEQARAGGPGAAPAAVTTDAGAVTAPAAPVSMSAPPIPGLPPGVSEAELNAYTSRPPTAGGGFGTMPAAPGGLPALSGFGASAGFAGPGGAGGFGAATMAPSFNFNFNMDGVPDREFGKRVLDSLASERTAIQHFLSGLLADAARVTYG